MLSIFINEINAPNRYALGDVLGWLLIDYRRVEMIKNFEEIKKQLSELSSVINSFKSEAVQLKIVELIFQRSISEKLPKDDSLSDTSSTRVNSSIAKKKVASKRKKAKDENGEKIKKPGKVGPATVLSELITDGYFDEARTIKDIIDHSDNKKARKFRANELSSPLARFVRDGRLNRDKNQDNQYEYTKK